MYVFMYITIYICYCMYINICMMYVNVYIYVYYFTYAYLYMFTPPLQLPESFSPDPCTTLNSLVYYGQRPWREQTQSLEPADNDLENRGILSLQHLESFVNHSVSILSLHPPPLHFLPPPPLPLLPLPSSSSPLPSSSSSSLNRV